MGGIHCEWRINSMLLLRIHFLGLFFYMYVCIRAIFLSLFFPVPLHFDFQLNTLVAHTIFVCLLLFYYLKSTSSMVSVEAILPFTIHIYDKCQSILHIKDSYLSTKRQMQSLQKQSNWRWEEKDSFFYARFERKYFLGEKRI